LQSVPRAHRQIGGRPSGAKGAEVAKSTEIKVILIAAKDLCWGGSCSAAPSLCAHPPMVFIDTSIHQD
jgi:hypothetical protein